MPQMGLKDKVAIVTGAGSRGDGIGNGRAAAILLAREGAKVALLDAMKEWAEATKAMIDAEGGTSMVVIADVADQVSSAASVKATVSAWGRLDILVNNVGIGGPIGNAVDVDTAAWDAAMRVNVTSMMLMAKHAIPEMRKRGAGSIVNIASIDGLRGGNPSLFYSTSKGAVVNMTRSMAAPPRAGGHPRQLHRARLRLYANGLCPRHGARAACGAPQEHSVADRGYRLGRRQWRRVSGVRSVGLGVRHHPIDRRRLHGRYGG
jgi:NAD(P)-dependent dehydrogenase (short-subunit alcohol dehydrogenase family)